MQGLWQGPPANVDWCEPNYVVTPYVAEWWNTLSSLPMVALGAFGLWRWSRLPGGLRRHAWLFAGLGMVGVGSTAFHGTLLRAAQALDELPMVYLGMVAVWAVALRAAPRESGGGLAAAMGVYAVGFTVAYFTSEASFVVFVASYGALVAYAALRSMWLTWGRAGPPLLGRLLQVSSVGFLGSLAFCWIPEHVLLPCDHPLQVLPLHAIWHLAAGLGTYTWCLWVVGDRARVEGRDVRLDGGFVA